MIRGIAATFLWACLAGAVGIGLFFVKHEVKDLETRLVDINHDIQRNREEMHVLHAEWAYLNDPARLRTLAEKDLGMHPIGANQVAADLDSLPGSNGLPAFAALPADRLLPPAAVAARSAGTAAEVAGNQPARPAESAQAGARAPAVPPVPAPRPRRAEFAAAGDPTQINGFVVDGNGEAR